MSGTISTSSLDTATTGDQRVSPAAHAHAHAPWSFKKCESDPTVYQLLDADGRVIGHPRRGTGGKAEANELEASARLNVAAPDMLSCLIEIINACDVCGKDDDLSLVDTFTQEMEDRARAAIAKAEGR